MDGQTDAAERAATGYYDALIAAWNSPVQPPSGVTGTGLTPAMTTQEKCDTINQWTMVGQIPASFTLTGDQIANAIHWPDFSALVAGQQMNVLQLCAISGQLLGGSSNTALLAMGMMLNYFPGGSATRAALTALAKGMVRLWWGVPVAENGGGLTGPVSLADTQAAGLS